MLSSASRASFTTPCEKMDPRLPHAVLERSFTPGTLTPITYLRSHAWSNYFSALYKNGVAAARRRRRVTTLSSSGAGGRAASSVKEERSREKVFTAPLFQCPLCFSPEKMEKSGGDPSSSTAVGTPSSFSLAHSDTSSWESGTCSVQGKRTDVVPPWYTPLQMMRHLSYSHMSDGYSPRAFQLYNAHVMEALRRRITIPTARAESSQVDTSGGGGAFSSSLSCGSSASATSFPTVPLPRLRLLVWVDVANIDLGASEVLLEMLTSTSLHPIFKRIPIGWCTTQELFVPHSCATLHGVFQLRLLNRNSDMFPFYAPTRTESGDLAISSMITRLRQMSFAAAASNMVLPPMVLLTLDAMQRDSAVELFGTGCHGTGGVVVVPSSCNSLSSIYRAFLKALDDGILL